MSYISGSRSADNGSRDIQLHRELQEQKRLEEKSEAAADRWEHDQIEAVFSQLDRYTVEGPSGQQTQSLLALAAGYATQPERAVTAPRPDEWQGMAVLSVNQLSLCLCQ